MIAQVIVDISNSEVDRVFDYAIDDFPDAKEGFRVMVPFGRMNIEGYIVQLKDRTLRWKYIIIFYKADRCR